MRTIWHLVVLLTYTWYLSLQVLGANHNANDNLDCGFKFSENRIDSEEYSILPEKIDSASDRGKAWLFPSNKVIQDAYEIGKKECDTFYQKELQSVVNLDNLTPPYIDTKDIPKAGLKSCRGTDLLYNITGLILWPFGPIDQCETHSRSCWFGVLSCGNFQSDHLQSVVQPQNLKHLQRMNITSKDDYSSNPSVIEQLIKPQLTRFTMQSMNLNIRIIGKEIVVPQKIVVPISSNEHEDVLIVQYQLSLPSNGNETNVEIRQLEFYPNYLNPPLLSMLSEEDKLNGIMNGGMVYLGSKETRTKPWSAIKVAPSCCGCEEKIHVLRTPQPLRVIDNSAQCKLSSTPSLCPAGSSKFPGRWIKANDALFSDRCHDHDHEHSHSNSSTHFSLQQWVSGERSAICHLNHHRIHDQHATQTQATTTHDHSLRHSNSQDHRRKQRRLVKLAFNNHVEEEQGTHHWLFSPYSCRFHFYTHSQLQQCFSAMNYSHIHAHGDFAAKDFSLFVGHILGAHVLSEHELGSDDLRNNNNSKHHVFLSEGFSFNWNEQILRLIEKSPVPDIFLTNYAVHHRMATPPIFNATLHATEMKYWTETRNMSSPLPRLRVFQSSRDMHGRRSSSVTGVSASEVRSNNFLLRMAYQQLGFLELDEFMLTRGRYNDNSHIYDDGMHALGTSVRYMEAMILFNMLCNDWYATTASKK